MPGMLLQQNYAEAGYVAPGYCAPWSPPAGLANVAHPAMSFNLSRLPSSPEFQISFEQWQKPTGGGLISAGAPYAVRLYMSLSWPQMPAADLNNWLTFFRSVACGQSESWQWWNPAQGNAMPVRFADAKFPEAPETGWGNHQVNSLRLMMDINYPALPVSGAASYDSAMGTCFAIGSTLIQLPPPVRPKTGSALESAYVLETASDGLPMVGQTAKLTRNAWTLAWTTLSRAHWIRLQAFFMTWVRGMQQTFTWYDWDGTPRTVRLAQTTITVKQLGWNRYSCDLALTEDLSA